VPTNRSSSPTQNKNSRDPSSKCARDWVALSEGNRNIGTQHTLTNTAHAHDSEQWLATASRGLRQRAEACEYNRSSRIQQKTHEYSRISRIQQKLAHAAEARVCSRSSQIQQKLANATEASNGEQKLANTAEAPDSEQKLPTASGDIGTLREPPR